MDGLNNNYRRVCRIRIVKEIILNQSQLDTLTDHAMKSGQDESCAMLLGIQKEESFCIPLKRLSCKDKPITKICSNLVEKGLRKLRNEIAHVKENGNQFLESYSPCQ